MFTSPTTSLIQYLSQYRPFFLYAAGALLNLAAVAHAEPGFVGAQQCRACHAQAYADWQQSDHAKAMQPANETTVLGNFNDIELEFHDIKSRLFRKDKRFYISTVNADGQRQAFDIKYTLGHYPLQQYLVATGNGRLQALNIAWDSRSNEQGGQHWYHLQADEKISPQHPFFWTGYFQNWNSRCAECHVTDYKKNYRIDDNDFSSSWTDGSVACEACHGPGAKHVALARQGRLSKTNHGFARSKPKSLTWHFEKGRSIASAVGLPSGSPSVTPSADAINMCGRCHALRMPLAANKANADFHNTFQLQLLHQGAYFADGQIQDEVFVLGSFLQSKMHQQGVSCGNCHNPHTGKVKIQGNGLCAQCHAPATYDSQAHHHHPPASTGAQCVNCHMPARTYMQVDPRRDHSFTVPDPVLSAATAVPNACTGCHAGKDNRWAIKRLEAWGVTPNPTHWAYTNARARALDGLAGEELLAHIANTGNAPIVRATLIEQLGALDPAKGLQAARAMLSEKNPVLRIAAVNALQSSSIAVRWQTLAPHINDTNRGVRYAIAQSLAEAYSQLPPKHRTSLQKLLQEYRSALAHTLDAPGTQLSLAALELALGNRQQALQAYQRALAIAPAFVPALVNLSEFYRSEGKAHQAEELLNRALQVAPDSATVQHAHGLHRIRQKDYSAALGYLAKAVSLADANPRHAYVYAIALDSQGDTAQAIDVLSKAASRWPNQYELLLTLVMFIDKTGATSGESVNDSSSGRPGDIAKYLHALQKIAPESPSVQHFSEKYKSY